MAGSLWRSRRFVAESLMVDDGRSSETLDPLALDGWHRSKGARMVPFAGYEMPVQYEGIIAEHVWTREKAGLFDVSHMGQLLVHGQRVDLALERLLPGDLQGLPDMKLKYSLLLDEDGGIIDDLMATRRGADFYIVVNGATKHGDIREFERRLPREIVVDYMKEQALLALQGPRAAEVLDRIIPEVASLASCRVGLSNFPGARCGSAALAIPVRTGSRSRSPVLRSRSWPAL
jgi:aminomethyltransferase